MSLVVDFIIIAFIILGILAGVKKGLIKSLVSIVGLVAVVILSYSLRIPLANFLIDNMPFFSFGGILEGLSSINILIYNVVAFILIFIVLYSVLNIILVLTGFIDTLLKFTVIWIIPSKIGGAIVGFLEAWIYLFLVAFIMLQFSFTADLIRDSKMANIILDNTPIIGTYLSGASEAAKEIYETIEECKEDKNINLDLRILTILIDNDILTKEKAQELMDIGKVEIENVTLARGNGLWLNI